MMNAPVKNPRGFTLLIALIFTSVVLAVGLALLNISYNQVILASTSRQSQYAFYAADSAMECALYEDNKADLFDYNSEPGASGSLNGTVVGYITCENQTFPYTAFPISGNSRETTFSIPCPSGGSSVQATVTVYKYPVGSAPSTIIYANGFSTCDVDDPQQIERGLESKY